MKVPRSQMMSARAEFQLVKKKGESRVGKFMILSTLPSSEAEKCKFAFITSKKVGKAHQRNFVRRRFRDLISRHGDQFCDNRYIVMIGRHSAPKSNFEDMEKEFLHLAKKLGIIAK